MREGWSSRLITAFVVLLLTIISSSCATQYRSSELIRYQLRHILVPPTQSSFQVDFPLIYYIVSEDGHGSLSFSLEELEEMNTGAKDWNNKTNGMVKIELIPHWIPPSNFDPYVYKDFRIKTVWKVHYEDEITKKLYEIYDPFCGLSWGQIIILVESPRCNFWRSTFTHELGHQFGLLHIKSKYPSVMNPGVNSVEGGKTISKFDLLQFCMLYDCMDQEWYKKQTN